MFGDVDLLLIPDNADAHSDAGKDGLIRSKSRRIVEHLAVHSRVRLQWEPHDYAAGGDGFGSDAAEHAKSRSVPHLSEADACPRRACLPVGHGVVYAAASHRIARRLRIARPVRHPSPKKLLTSTFSRLLSEDSDCAADSTWVDAEPESVAPHCTSVMFDDTCMVPSAARCTLREISLVAAPCCSTAEAIDEEIPTSGRWCRRYP